MNTPKFTRAELMELWTAITEFCENHEEEDPPSEAAESARLALDAYFAASATEGYVYESEGEVYAKWLGASKEKHPPNKKPCT